MRENVLNWLFSECATLTVKYQMSLTFRRPLMHVKLNLKIGFYAIRENVFNKLISAALT